MKKILFFLFLLCSNYLVSAQVKHLNDVSATQAHSKLVTKLFFEKKFAQSFEELSKYWPLPKNEFDELVMKSIKYMNVLEERYGEPIGMLKVKNETIDEIAIRETYLIRYEYSAVRYKFTYYKNNNGWILNAFKWDDSFTEEFE